MLKAFNAILLLAIPLFVIASEYQYEGWNFNQGLISTNSLERLGGNLSTRNSYKIISDLASNIDDDAYRFSTTNLNEESFVVGPINLFGGNASYTNSSYFYPISKNNTTSVTLRLKIKGLNFFNRSNTAPNNRVDFRLVDKNNSLMDQSNSKNYFIGLSLKDIAFDGYLYHTTISSGNTLTSSSSIYENRYNSANGINYSGTEAFVYPIARTDNYTNGVIYNTPIELDLNIDWNGNWTSSIKINQEVIYSCSGTYNTSHIQGFDSYQLMFQSLNKSDYIDIDEISIFYTPITPPADFDGDGLDDFYEMLNSGTLAYEKDTDQDGLSDYEEIENYFTDPLRVDTDDDGLNDGNEIANGTNPLQEDIEQSLLSIEFSNTSANFFNERVSLSDTIGSNCIVELIWSQTNSLESLKDDTFIITNSLTGTGVSDRYGFGYWTGIMLNAVNLPSQSGYIWARVYDETQMYFIDVGEVNISNEINNLTTNKLIKIPEETHKKQFYILSEGQEFLSNEDDTPSNTISNLNEQLNILSNQINTLALTTNLLEMNLIRALTTNEILEVSINSLSNQMNSLITTNAALEMIRDLRMGSKMLQVSNGILKVLINLEESNDLTATWSNSQNIIEVDIPTDDDVKFYRFSID